MPPLFHRNAPTLAPIAPPITEPESAPPGSKAAIDIQKKAALEAAAQKKAVSIVVDTPAPTAAPAVAAGGPPPFIPRPGETPAEALRRRLKEAKNAVAVAPTSSSKMLSSSNLLDDDLGSGSYGDFGGGGYGDEEVEVEDLFKPNIFFQNARYSGMAPAPASLPKHQQLPNSIFFYLRATDVAPLDAYKRLPDAVREIIVEAKVVPEHESAGPIARIDFTKANVLGLGVRKDAIEMGVSQLCIDVPSHDAYSKQDPRIEPSSLTFQPYQMASLHGDWLPRINVPIKADKPRPASAESPIKRRKKPPSFKQDLEELEKTGIDDDETLDKDEPEQMHVGNPYASPSQRSSTSSRASLASERRLRESMRRMSKLSSLDKMPPPPSSPATSQAAVPASPDTPQTNASPASFSHSTSFRQPSSGSLGQPPTPQRKQSMASVIAAAKEDDKKKDAEKATPEANSESKGKDLAPTSAKLKARGDTSITPRTPGGGCLSSRSMRSNCSGVAGGPPERDLWPRDFAADSVREESLEGKRIEARKALREKRAKEQAELQRRASVQRRGGVGGRQGSLWSRG